MCDMDESEFNRYKKSSLQAICQQFVGAPYLGGACGEGESGEFDQFPLFRFDAFDCVTFVNTVLSLHRAKGPAEFKSELLRLNYLQNVPDYLERLHFTSVDWNPKLQRDGVLSDVTASLVSRGPANIEGLEGSGSSEFLDQPSGLLCEAGCTIERSAWLRQRNIDTIRLSNATLIHREAKLRELHEKANTLCDEDVQLRYLSIEHLLGDTETAKTTWANFPPVSVVEIVRPNWNIRDQIGTNLLVSHMGFVFQDKNAPNEQNCLRFYHASSDKMQVVDVLFSEYLSQFVDSPTIKGVHVLKVI